MQNARGRINPLYLKLSLLRKYYDPPIISSEIMLKNTLEITFVQEMNYRLILIFSLIYSLAVSIIPFFRGIPVLPVTLAIWVLLYFSYRWKRIPDVLRRWFFYLFLTSSYQALRFVVGTYTGEFHCRGIIEFETGLFGQLPTIFLQNLLHDQGILKWYDYIFAAFHGSLFAIPFVIPGIILWKKDSVRMKRSAAAVVLLSLAGYLTYVLFPLTPPWMASLEGVLPPMERITFSSLSKIVGPWLAGAFQPSPRGAMPSLHTGLPLLMILIFLKEFGRKGLWAIPIVLVICFEIIYGAEHYVVDVVAGIVYAIAAYWLVYRVLVPDSVLEKSG